MGKISVQLGGLADRFGVEEAYRMIGEAGFDAVDVNPLPILTGPEIRAYKRSPILDMDENEILSFFRPYGDAAAKYGLLNGQAHAPYPSCMPRDEDYSEYLMRGLEKVIGGCAAMGCHRLVIHPFFYAYDDQLSPDEEMELNLKSYTRLIPFARRHGVVICLENMFTRHGGKLYAACCSDISFACRLIDELNARAGQRLFGFCLDTGHLLLLGKDARQALLQLGDRLEALHIHDNDGIHDQHLAPYTGVLDWDRFLSGLRDVRFSKIINFETHGTMSRFDPALAPALLRLLAQTGRMFWERTEK